MTRYLKGYGLAVASAREVGLTDGPAVLYEDLMGRAVRAVELAGPYKARRLRTTGPCLMCEMGLGAASCGVARPELLEQGRDSEPIRAFADRTRKYWGGTVCDRCRGAGPGQRCRPHLPETISQNGSVDLATHRVFVESTFKHLTAYSRSFRWECRKTETDEDRAALISAVGWCTGWRAFLWLVQ